MTDNEIIKVLECCRHISCVDGCPLDGEIDCGTKLVVNALDLTKRQQEMIEALIAGQETLQKHFADKMGKIIERLEEEAAEHDAIWKETEDIKAFAGKCATNYAIAIVKGVQNE